VASLGAFKRFERVETSCEDIAVARTGIVSFPPRRLAHAVSNSLMCGCFTLEQFMRTSFGNGTDPGMMTSMSALIS